MDAQFWEESYRSGRWRYLNRPDEMARYAAIGGYARAFADGGRLLDLGCGEGILLQYLRPETIGRYFGIDWSAEAISQAQAKHPEIEVMCGDLNQSDPPAGKQFEVIIFNEVLYYLDSPFDVLCRFTRVLAPGGIMIVSMCDQPGKDFVARVAAVWNFLKPPPWEQLDGIQIKNLRSVYSWQIAVYRRLEIDPSGDFY